MTLLRIPKARIRQDIQALIRTFHPIVVVILRVTPGPSDDFGDPTETSVEVYRGEALLVPAGGTVMLLGIGEVETKDPHLLISGSWPVEQGDRVTVEGRSYTITDDPDPWNAFLLVPLKQREISASLPRSSDGEPPESGVL